MQKEEELKEKEGLKEEEGKPEEEIEEEKEAEVEVVEKPKVKRIKKKIIRKGDYYKIISGGKLERTKQYCPKCGVAVFLAEHNDRISCGKCGYTEFKKR